MDRFHLVQDVIDRLPQLGARAAYAKQAIRNALIEHRQYINERGEDHPFVLGWRWGEEGSSWRNAQFDGGRQRVSECCPGMNGCCEHRARVAFKKES